MFGIMKLQQLAILALGKFNAIRHLCLDMAKI
jgi:hypothetical protein